MLKRTITLTGAAAVALMTATGPAAAFFGYDTDHIEKLPITGNSFETELAREYQNLSIYERDQMFDWPDAELYADRAIAAAGGGVVMPLQARNWDIDSGAKMREIASARAELMTLLDAGARENVPDLAAHAQATYDCWVEQQEEGWQAAHIAKCREDFRLALVDLRAAMTPEPVAAIPAPQPQIPQDWRATVFFDFDRATIRPTAAQTLNQIAASVATWPGNPDLVVVGHTDRSGSAAYNQRLSAARARAVVDALAARGISARMVDDLEVLAMGESQPRVATGDGVREQANRRVVIEVADEADLSLSIAR